MKIIITLLLSSVLSQATTYYVDFTSGNDASAGTATGTAWRTLPGTRTTTGAAFLNSAWGPFNGTTKVPTGTIFQIKAGGTHSSSAGGYVWINSSFYNESGTTVTIQSDSSWGTGSTATLDASGMSIGIATMIIQIDGLTVKGLNFNNSPIQGVQAKEKPSGAVLTGLTFNRLSFYNNGTSFLTDTAGAGSGQLTVRNGESIIVSSCTFDGNNQFINGFLGGNDHMHCYATVTDCTAIRHKGDLVTDDSGIGFKCFNSQITYSNCVSTSNLKGFDSGEQNGQDAGPGGTAANILIKVISCTARTNSWGINFNSAAGAYGGTVNFYAINNLVTDNTQTGMNTYAGPHNLYVVHNVFDRNGASASARNGSQISTTPNSTADVGTINTYIYNNIFQNQLGTSVTILNKYHGAANIFTLDSDYNSYHQTGTEPFCVWSYYYGPTQAEFSFGANGPGRSSGNWYSWYANSAVAPSSGTGHFHNDANSKGTGCTDITLPVFNSNYALSSAYSGTSLSGKSWYTSEMGLDRGGNSRSVWSMGLYEFNSLPSVPRNVRLTASTPTIGWDANTDGITTGYKLFVKDAGGTIIQTNDVGNVTSYSPSGLTSGLYYTFYVRAYASIPLESSDSNIVSWISTVSNGGGSLSRRLHRTI